MRIISPNQRLVSVEKHQQLKAKLDAAMSKTEVCTWPCLFFVVVAAVVVAAAAAAAAAVAAAIEQLNVAACTQLLVAQVSEKAHLIKR